MLQLILGNSTHLEKSEEYRFFKPWLGDGLLISSGQLVGKLYSGGF
jgi:cytochrome P450 family 4